MHKETRKLKCVFATFSNKIIKEHKKFENTSPE